MKKTLLSVFLSVCMMGAIQNASAQCDSARYYSKIFSSVSTSTVMYTDPAITTDSMDIYVPTNDPLTSGRKAILLFHGGSFIAGTRKDAFEVNMCTQFALRGYVTFSADYRLATAILDMTDSNTAFPHVAQAISDGKAAMRYLKRYANTLGIDTNFIVIGGESAGAIMADHMAYLTSLSQATPLLVTAFNSVGGTIEGNSGNPGYTSFNARAVLDNAGALLYSGFLNGSALTPIYMAQGSNDQTVPYDCGKVLSGLSDIQTCGSGVLKPIADGLGIVDFLQTFNGAGHCPWDTNALQMDTVEAQTASFLYKFVCDPALSIKQINDSHVGLYPNPSNSQIHITTDVEMQSVEVMDMMGRTITTVPVTGTQSNVNVSTLNPGLYVARINLKENNSFVVRNFSVE